MSIQNSLLIGKWSWDNIACLLKKTAHLFKQINEMITIGFLLFHITLWRFFFNDFHGNTSSGPFIITFLCAEIKIFRGKWGSNDGKITKIQEAMKCLLLSAIPFASHQVPGKHLRSPDLKEKLVAPSIGELFLRNTVIDGYEALTCSHHKNI